MLCIALTAEMNAFQTVIQSVRFYTFNFLDVVLVYNKFNYEPMAGRLLHECNVVPIYFFNVPCLSGTTTTSVAERHVLGFIELDG